MNAKSPDIVARFIELRASGWSFPRLATELNVARSTLLEWSRKHHHDIRNLRALAHESRVEDAKLSRDVCLNDLSDDLRRLREEIARRDLSDIPTARLFCLAARLRAEANLQNGPVHFTESTTVLPDNDNLHYAPTIDWEA